MPLPPVLGLTLGPRCEAPRSPLPVAPESPATPRAPRAPSAEPGTTAEAAGDAPAVADAPRGPGSPAAPSPTDALEWPPPPWGSWPLIIASRAPSSGGGSDAASDASTESFGHTRPFSFDAGGSRRPSIDLLLPPADDLSRSTELGAATAGTGALTARYFARLGQLTHLATFEGRKHTRRCRQIVEQLDMVSEPTAGDAAGAGKDLSELWGPRGRGYLMTPTLNTGSSGAKFRLGVDADGALVSIRVLRTPAAAMHVDRLGLAEAMHAEGALPLPLPLLPGPRGRPQAHILQELALAHEGSHLLQPLDLIGRHGKLYAISEYLVGGPALRLTLLEEPLRATFARRALTAVAKDLRLLQRLGIVHHAVHLRHIHWSEHDIVLGHFTWARFVDAAGRPAAGPAGPTPVAVHQHPAPESLVPGGRSDGRVDLFGLGMALWHLLLGAPHPLMDALEGDGGHTASHLAIYALWHRRHRARQAAAAAEEVGVGLYQALVAAQARAAAVDGPLAELIFCHLTDPHPGGRLGGDALVLEAAGLSQAISAEAEAKLGAALARMARAQHSRVAVWRRRLLDVAPSWREAVAQAPRPEGRDAAAGPGREGLSRGWPAGP